MSDLLVTDGIIAGESLELIAVLAGFCFRIGVVSNGHHSDDLGADSNYSGFDTNPLKLTELR